MLPRGEWGDYSVTGDDLRNCPSATRRTSERKDVSLVLHADDFGMNAAVTRGIVHGFSHGLLTSTSLLANAPDTSAAVVAWKELLRDQQAGGLPSAAARRRLHDPAEPLELGVHLNLTQGRPLTQDRYPSELLDNDGRFPGIGKVFGKLWRVVRPLEPFLFQELSAQIERLLDHGVAPTHLNGHQYIETLPGIAPLIPRLMEKYGIPVVRVAQERRLGRSTFARGEIGNWALAQVKRLFATRFLRQMEQQQVQYPDAFFGTSHAGRIDFELIQLFLKRSTGLVEIGLHPAMAVVHQTLTLADDGWNDPLAESRPQELALLTSPKLVELLERSQVKLGRLSSRSEVTSLKSAA